MYGLRQVTVIRASYRNLRFGLEPDLRRCSKRFMLIDDGCAGQNGPKRFV